MPEFVVFEAGGDGIFAGQNFCAGRTVLRDAVLRGQIIRLVIGAVAKTDEAYQTGVEMTAKICRLAK